MQLVNRYALIVALLGACFTGAGVLSAGGAEPSAWERHSSEHFSIEHPRQWQVRAQEDGRVTVRGPDGIQVVVWPVYLEAQLRADAAARLLARLVVRSMPGLEWTRPRPVSEYVHRAIVQNGPKRVVALFARIPTAQGTAAYLYLASAPPSRFDALQDDFARIWASFRPARVPGSGEAGARHRYRHWMEPNERAFSFEAPEGWRVQGGLVRHAAVDVRPGVSVHSPDGAIQLFIGDARIPPFILPAPMLASAGLTEGASYSPGYGITMVVRRYLPGAAFAREYAGRASQLCAGLELTDVRDRPETAQQIKTVYQRFNSPWFRHRLDTGEARFRCRRGDEIYVGYVFAGTQAVQASAMAGGSGVWNVQYLYGLLAPAARSKEAHAVLGRMVASFRLDPNWTRMQTGLAGNVARIAAETGQHISGLIAESYERNSAIRDESVAKFACHIRGVEKVEDPVTGETYEVKSGSRYYWIDAMENVVGTDLHRNPDPMEFRRMIRRDLG